MENTAYKKFGFVWFTLTAVALLCVGLINLIVDPLGIHKVVAVEGFNKVKTEAMRTEAFVRVVELERARPDAVIVGSSRVKTGLDENHPGFDRTVKSRFNLGLPLLNAYEINAYTAYANSLNPLRQIVYGLDFFSFNVHSPRRPDFDEKRVNATKNLHYAAKRVEDFSATLFSAKMLNSSIKTLRRQPEKTATSKETKALQTTATKETAKGEAPQNDGGNTAAEVPIDTLEEKLPRTVRTNFRFTERTYMSKVWFAGADAAYGLTDKRGKSAPLEAFRATLTLAHENSIDLTLVISPIHARMIEAIRISGLETTFEDWKRLLVKINEEEAAKRGRSPFPLWDFSGYNSVTTEHVPFDNEPQEMKYYIESSHYLKAAGNLALDRAFSHSEPGRNVPKDFGVLLTSKNIEATIEKTRRDGELYRRTHPKDIAEITEEAAVAKKKRDRLRKSAE
ncbi:MAG: hypothetical protein OEV59_03155 [Deltaproteobacteria bacterium]|nr:hypothetical protein [Deltaproteobacteria bacterium]